MKIEGDNKFSIIFYDYSFVTYIYKKKIVQILIIVLVNLIEKLKLSQFLRDERRPSYLSMSTQNFYEKNLKQSMKDEKRCRHNI